MNNRIHLQQAAPSNQAANRYRNGFLQHTKFDKHDKEGLKQLKRAQAEEPSQPSRIPGGHDEAQQSVLLLLYKNALHAQEEQLIRDEQHLLDNLAQKLAQHGEPTTTESAFLAALTNEPTAGLGHLKWLQQVLEHLEEVRFYTL
ncbi:hypothetical protein CEP54_001532 [Fusarium duplospermum]|uniref:Uncharacterized protein n=1 Tax=Fusarium duplospermum TaxID=1325734 RepID=A0A428R0K8_9HYPO|nr:hypothetical protein CEP54_001532 [Fusarium duplospermum]